MDTKPAASLGARAIGYLCIMVGAGAWLLVVASIFFAVMQPHSDTSTLPLIAAALAALGTIGCISGSRLMRGLPPAGSFLRQLAGVFLLLVAAIFWVAGSHDSDVTVWPAIILAIAGMGLFLSWRIRDGRLHD
jgi:hypothetical protein